MGMKLTDVGKSDLMVLDVFYDKEMHSTKEVQDLSGLSPATVQKGMSKWVGNDVLVKVEYTIKYRLNVDYGVAKAFLAINEAGKYISPPKPETPTTRDVEKGVYIEPYDDDAGMFEREKNPSRLFGTGY